MITEHFCCWDADKLRRHHASGVTGPLYEDRDERFRSRVYAIRGGELGRELILTEHGACFGFIQDGTAHVTYAGAGFTVSAGQWFTTPTGGCVFRAEPGAVGLLVQRLGFRGLGGCGGPIEERGRLRYIDGCSDTVLSCPPLLGDPCLNHLHFPPEIDQTEHTHPSVRIGIVARGRGDCITPIGTTPLVPGLIFVIPKDGLHRFRTGPDSSMDVIAYHPDSDWGPTHESHPMVNRTWVDGRKIDNRSGIHAEAEIIMGAEGGG